MVRGYVAVSIDTVKKPIRRIGNDWSAGYGISCYEAALAVEELPHLGLDQEAAAGLDHMKRNRGIEFPFPSNGPSARRQLLAGAGILQVVPKRPEVLFFRIRSCRGDCL